MYVKAPQSVWNVEDLPAGVRLLWTRFGPMFAAVIRRKRVWGDVLPLSTAPGLAIPVFDLPSESWRYRD
ncbi:hypothetical protein [Brevundimonas subvibrioides]|uniref:hypothetical protein n=1 Tax=Brevundimonas subvibrioides TaxID=74313 RepID=UPI0022B5C1D1|nr:hypothetical protein [Brevundimonas subvibrioides]